MSLQTFHNDKKIKEKYLNRVIAHMKADNLIRGQGWKEGKGCAVGCTLETYDHSRYPIELGIPEWAARVEDILFEGMSKIKSRNWPEVFLNTIPVGVDLDKIKVPFTIVVLEHSLKTLDSLKVDNEKFPDVVKAIQGSSVTIKQMIVAQKSGDKDKLAAARSAAESAAESAARSAASSAESAAESAARSAAWSAESAARSAAWSAESAARSAESAAWSARSAAWSAESAARSAAWSAESAARSAESAAWSAAWSARSAAWSAAWSAAYDYFADRLIELFKNEFQNH